MGKAAHTLVSRGLLFALIGRVCMSYLGSMTQGRPFAMPPKMVVYVQKGKESVNEDKNHPTVCYIKEKSACSLRNADVFTETRPFSREMASISREGWRQGPYRSPGNPGLLREHFDTLE